MTDRAKPNIPARDIPRLLLRLAGGRTVVYLVLGSVAGLGQSYVDIVLSAYLSLFVASLGLLDVSASPGVSFLPHGSAFAIGAGLLVTGILRSVFQFLVGECTIVGMEAVTARLRLLTVKQLLDVDRRRSPTPAADMVLRISEVYPRTAQVTYAIIQLFAALLQGAGLFVFAVVVARREALAGIAGVGVVALFIWAIGKRIQRYYAAQPAIYARLASGLERISRNQLLVRVLRTEREELPRFKALILDYYRRSVTTLSLGNLASVLPSACGVILIVAIIYLSQAVWHTPGALLLSFMYIFVRLVRALASASGQASVIATYGVFLMRTLEDVNTENDERLPHVLSFDPAETGLPKIDHPRPDPEVDDATPAIEVANVSFRYEGSDAWALRAFTLSVAPGEHVGITGPSGCGKSTLVQLVLGVLDPSEGRVVIGGRDTREVQPVEHVRIGYVGAEPFLFDGTVEENLRYGSKSQPPESEVWDALEAARCAQFVRALAEGLQTRLGEGGEGLSAGQKQRISLARALLGKPQLLVLDEATANLDSATETEIAVALSGLLGKVTTLVIAHRPGILARCGRVVRMEAP